jgi:hypothetical protein
MYDTEIKRRSAHWRYWHELHPFKTSDNCEFMCHTTININPLNAELNPICHLLVLLGDLTFMGLCILSIFQYVYIQQDATLRSLFISGNCFTCFGWYLHPSSGVHTTVSTASGICHTVTAIGRYRGRVGTGLSVLWVAYATHSTLKPVFEGQQAELNDFLQGLERFVND